jgi:hypothetical protein
MISCVLLFDYFVIPAKAGIHEKYWIPYQVRNDNIF